MKKITKIIGIALIFGLIIVGFAGAVSATDISNISISGLPAVDTVKGGNTAGSVTATVTIGDAAATDINCQWNSGVTGTTTKKFTYNSTPTLTITLPGGNTYSSNPTITTNLGENYPATLSGNTITVTYPNTGKKTISAITIPSNLQPVSGATVKTSTTITESSTSFSKSATVTWKEKNNDEFTTFSGSTFNTGKVYKATITLTSGDDSLFANSVDASIASGSSGSPSVGTPTINTAKTSLTVDITYPQTTASSITDVKITVDAPNAGTTPASTATVTSTPANSVNVNSVTWKETGTSTTATSFSKDKTYTATITLSPKSTSVFDDSLATASNVKVNNNSSTTSSLSDDKKTLTVTYAFSSTGNTINSVTINGLEEPATGEQADTTISSITGNDSLSIPTTGTTVSWYKTDDSSKTAVTTFEANTKYSVKITIPTQTGYTFATTMTAKIGSDTATVTSTNSGISITKDYTNTGTAPIKTVTITGIEKPEVGNRPDYSATINGNTSISLNASSIKWYASDSSSEMSSSSTFEPEKKYKVVIDISSGTNYVFKDVSGITATINGSSVSSSNMSLSTDKKTLTISYTFDKTNGTVSNLSLTTTTPKLGAAMSTNVSATSTPSNSIYTPTLTWSPSGNTFEGGQAYTSTITVNTKSGYLFTGKPNVTLNGSSVSSSDITLVNDTTITIKHAYEKLATPIASVSITMDEPVVAKEASMKAKVTSSPSSDIDATVSWSPAIPESGLFDEETEYTATITLKNNNSNFAFTSNTTATVNIGKGETVPCTITSTPTATSMTVKCTFEETNKKGLLNLDIGDEEATVPYPTDFFKEIVAFFKAFFDFGSWKIFN